ncbi:MAG: hypothetical protein RLZZ280_1583, partial [Pseudomonadota bacterium]
MQTIPPPLSKHPSASRKQVVDVAQSRVRRTFRDGRPALPQPSLGQHSVEGVLRLFDGT